MTELSLLEKLSRQIAEQHVELQEIRRELVALRKEVAASKLQRAKPQGVQTTPAKTPLSSREMSKMMFVSWASRQPMLSDDETAEARQRRLLPVFEASNNCRVVGVDSLRG